MFVIMFIQRQGLKLKVIAKIHRDRLLPEYLRRASLSPFGLALLTTQRDGGVLSTELIISVRYALTYRKMKIQAHRTTSQHHEFRSQTSLVARYNT